MPQRDRLTPRERESLKRNYEERMMSQTDVTVAMSPTLVSGNGVCKPPGENGGSPPFQASAVKVYKREPQSR